MKSIDLCGMGNGMLDILVSVDQPEFDSLDLEKGGMRLVAQEAQRNLLDRFAGREISLVSGGSVANSVVAFSQLGGRGGFLTRIGDDRYGQHYRREFESLGVELGALPVPGGLTGTCVSLITPDAERTMRTCLGVSETISPADLNEELIRRSTWLFIEGYLLANPGGGTAAVREAVSLARRHDTRVALTFSDAWVVREHLDVVREILEDTDLLFANEEEACMFTGAADLEQAFERLGAMLPGVALTAGARGAFATWRGSEVFVPAFQCTPVDLTGAGDMFAGAMLYGLCQNIPLKDIVRAACFLSARVISQVGARINGDLQPDWKQAQTIA